MSRIVNYQILHTILIFFPNIKFIFVPFRSAQLAIRPRQGREQPFFGQARIRRRFKPRTFFNFYFILYFFLSEPRSVFNLLRTPSPDFITLKSNKNIHKSTTKQLTRSDQIHSDPPLPTSSLELSLSLSLKILTPPLSLESKYVRIDQFLCILPNNLIFHIESMVAILGFQSRRRHFLDFCDNCGVHFG
jgi:hypothetical protein